MSYPLSGAGRPADHGEVVAWTAAETAQHESDVSSVTGVFRSHHAELVRLAVLLLGDRPSAEDVVQDVFTRLCGRDLLPAGDGAVAYVRAAVLNRCRSALRRRALARRIGAGRDLPGWEASQHSVEHEVILAEDRRQVLAALAGLPRRRREVLVLRYWLGLPEAEIAQMLGIRPGTVKSTAARGLAALARDLGEPS
ncbi:MAG TPA: sigma-70 family RNA polymerase sigma factor [Streptosporangiaceae bacterium]|jgi:RNA polymerase sigma-70 factor (sigma-E family)